MQDVALFKISDVVMVNRKNFSTQTVNKSCYVLSCRLSGESEFSQNGKHFTAKRGDILYIPYGSSYYQRSNQEKVIYIHLEAFSAVSSRMMLWQAEDAAYICSLFLACFNTFKEKGHNYIYVCMSILYDILSLINFAPENIEIGENRTFDHAMQYLNTHIFEKEFSIDKLCENANISRTYFNKMFKKIYNTTPICFINDARIKKSKMLLKSGNYTNEEIADLCGFRDVKYFYVIFKKLTGQTTLKYKRKSGPSCQKEGHNAGEA